MLTSLIPAGYEGPTLAESFGGAPEQIIAVDVSLDGAVDLLIANGEFYLDGPPRPQHLSVLTNNGDATFAPIVDFPLPAFPNNPESNAGIAFINAADIDDDNDVDVVATAGWNYVLLLFNDGQGGFSRTLWLELEPGLVPTGAETGDLNSDGVVDLVTVNDGPADVSVFIGVGDGSFVHREDLGIAETGPAYRLGAVLGDLDADRALDIAVLHPQDSFIEVFWNASNAEFEAVRFADIDGSSLTHCDVDNDGDEDLVVADRWSNRAHILLNRSERQFAQGQSYSTGDGPWSVVCADLDGDSNRDLILPLLLDRGLTVLFNSGKGLFDCRVDRAFPVSSFPVSAQVADFDNDADADIGVVIAEHDGLTYFAGILENRDSD